jgi:hypothetical protein
LRFRGAVVAIDDLAQRRTGDTAGEQAAVSVDPEPVHAVKRRAGNELGDFIAVRERTAGGAENGCRRDSHAQYKPARHGIASRFYDRESIRPRRAFGKQNRRGQRSIRYYKMTREAATEIGSNYR